MFISLRLLVPNKLHSATRSSMPLLLPQKYSDPPSSPFEKVYAIFFQFASLIF